ncbi:MAG TPA: penicillin acylase family protein [Hyphomonadaceae bacterium]|nr:penicillin acylase family protein [Hyphomonadaceae bacterium]
MTFWKWALSGAAGIVLIGAGAAAAWLWAPAQPPFDASAAKAAAAQYDARVVRDKFGVPHIYGRRNADVVFGLGYAHAEDDWQNIEQVVRSNRGQLAEINGQASANSDYLIRALGNIEFVHDNYDQQVSAKAKEIAEGYAAGINLWCAEHLSTGCSRTAPVKGEDIIAGYANRPPFFYGLDGEINNILNGKGPVELSTKSAHEAYLGATDDIELGSNGIAVGPARSADNHTRLAVNSHQPYTGTVAWYEARLKSDEGIDMIGGVFPGSPLILHGAGPNLGWASTVNKPDVYDTFQLTVDDPKNPHRYKMDGQWKDLVERPIKFRVALFGPFSMPVEKRGLWSEHGPVFVTDHGVFAVSFAGEHELRFLDQYLAMNTAKSVADWRYAQTYFNAIPSVNYTVADSHGNIAYFYNARMPHRVEGWDRHKVLPGDTSDTLWKGWEKVESLPFVMNPTSGWVENSNNTPFQASSEQDNPRPGDFPASYGIETNMTNRALRAHELFGQDTSITRDEFIAYKMDHRYSADSNVRKMVTDLVAKGSGGDKEVQAGLDLIKSWDGSADMENRAAALAILTGQKAMGGQINGKYDHDKCLAALKEEMALLKGAYGRIDPKWSEVSRIERGKQLWPTDGGPDTLRAVYATGDLKKDKYLHGTAGDTFVLIADWAPDGTYKLVDIHQFGSATVDASSPHYADQSPIFAAGQFKEPPMTLDAVLKEATRDYRPGKTSK